jgi:menaquinone-dependent protoporphyrinogen IX oxidase
MKTKAALREICATAARVWPMTARPGRDPERFEHYEYVDHRWVRVIVEYNGEEKPPRRRVDDTVKKRLEDLTSDRSIDA